MFRNLMFILFFALTVTVHAQSVPTPSSGERNYILNPSAARNVVNTSVSSATIARGTTNKIDNIASFTCDASALAGYCEFAIATPRDPDTVGNCEAAAWVKGDASLYTLQITDGSGTLLSSSGTLSSYTDWTRVSATHVCGTDRKVRFTQTTAGTAPAVSLGRLYYGKNLGVGQVGAIGDWVSYTPTSQAFGSPTAIDFKWRRVGSNMEIVGRFTAGTTTAVEPRIYLPTGYSTSSSITTHALVGKFSRGVTTGQHGGFVLAQPSVTYLNFSSAQTFSGESANSSAIYTTTPLGTGETLLFTASVPIQGWTTAATAARADQTNYGWRTETCTGSWVTATTYACQTRRDGETMFVRGKISVTGTPTNAALTLTIPGGLSIDTTKFPATPTSVTTLEGHATLVDASDASRNHLGAILYNSTTSVKIRHKRTFNNNAYVVMDADLSNTLPFTWASGDTIEFEYAVPISGWVENGKAPVLVGSVTSSSSGAERIERVRVAPTCSTSPCTISQQSGAVSSVTRTAQGRYRINWNTGVWSGLPDCVFAIGGFSNPAYAAYDQAAGYIEIQMYAASTATATDGNFFAICMGAR